jgi:hypothetical protein
MAVVDFPDKPDGTPFIAPLNLLECSACKLAQLQHTVDPDRMFRNFWYRSGVTASMRAALKDVVAAAQKFVSLSRGDAVLDIGTNDGTLLEFYPKEMLRVGFEPAQTLAEEASAKGLIIVPDYFTRRDITGHSQHRFKIITCCGMFYDLDDPGEFLETVKLALHAEGIFVVQMNYLGSMLRNLAVDNISHEHLTYFSIASFQRLVEAHGLSLVGVKENSVNGGSIRLFVKIGTSTPPAVEEFIHRENTMLIDAWAWGVFSKSLDEIRVAILKYLLTALSRNDKLALCGASTRGLTTLHFLGLGKDTFTCAGDRDPRKHGRYYGATGIPIVSEEDARKWTDMMLVLPYHFEKEIIEREQAFLESGGKVVFPLPKPKVVSYRQVEYL